MRSLLLMHALRLGINPLAEGGVATASVPPVPPAADDSMDRAVMAEFIADQSSHDSDLHEMEELLGEVSQARPLRAPATASPIDPRTGVSAEEYGRAHAAGYVSAKCRRIDPTLASPSALVGEEAPVQTIWTQLRSQGGLSIPTDEWLSRCQEMETAFRTYHFLNDDSLSRDSSVINNMVAIIVAIMGAVDVRIVRRWVKLRTLIRMGLLNRARRQDAVDRRERKKRGEFAS